MIDLNLNGYTDLPKGKVANIATFLEMRAKPTLVTAKANDLMLDPMISPDLERYRTIFRAVGEDWLWFSRLTISDEALGKLIENLAFEIFFLVQEGKDIGILELDIHDRNDIELAYFGLSAGGVGRGNGHWLMNEAIKRAFDHHGAQRFHLHTCTMDHPAALGFYLKSGFVPYRRAVEVADDPRLQGFVSPDKGSHHPIIG